MSTLDRLERGALSIEHAHLQEFVQIRRDLIDLERLHQNDYWTMCGCARWMFVDDLDNPTRCAANPLLRYKPRSVFEGTGRAYNRSDPHLHYGMVVCPYCNRKLFLFPARTQEERNQTYYYRIRASKDGPLPVVEELSEYEFNIATAQEAH